MNSGATITFAPALSNRTITLIVPWAAGGGTDRLSRFMADQLQRELGKPVSYLEPVAEKNPGQGRG